MGDHRPGRSYALRQPAKTTRKIAIGNFSNERFAGGNEARYRKNRSRFFPV
jgi:hypothetical protein